MILTPSEVEEIPLGQAQDLRKLIKPINPKYSALEQVLTNRGVKYEDIPHYINTTDEDINDYKLLGEDKLWQAATKIGIAAANGEKTAIIIDVDCDGYCSSALLINFLYDIAPYWVKTCVTWYHHANKQHGLSDIWDKLVHDQNKLVIVPDAGTNDVIQHNLLAEAGITTIVLDHHLQEEISEHAIIINNQCSDYPNKHFCGTGIVWQFCRYMDNILTTHHADEYLDLVALANTADMMSLQSLETKHLINKGFQPKNIKNPFIYSMWQKNQFKLGEHITSWGAAFYIAPFVNAIVRSGTQQEKELIFNSMLKMKAFEKIPSNKRGHKLGEEEQLVEQAIRTCTNVKNRQTRAQDAGMDFLENMIQEQNLLDNKVILFLLKPGQVDRNIAGLIANKFMSKYQRPCCILTRVQEDKGGVCWDTNSADYGCTIADIQVSYQGSARGCDKVGVTEFKDICDDTGVTMYTIGHQGAFGLGIKEENVKEFIRITNENLKYMSEEPLYYVDYIYDGGNVNPQNIIDIAEMDTYWGKDVDEALVAIKGLKVTKDMVTLMSPDKTPTLKIVLPNKVSIIKFGSSQEEYNKIATDGYIEMDIIGKCNKNEWMGWVNAQIMLEAYEITDSAKYYF